MSEHIYGPFVIRRTGGAIYISLKAFPEAPIGWESDCDAEYRKNHMLIVMVKGFPALEFDFDANGWHVTILGLWAVGGWPWSKS